MKLQGAVLDLVSARSVSRTPEGPRGGERRLGAVDAMPRRRAAVLVIAREPTRLAREPRPCRDGVVPHRFAYEPLSSIVPWEEGLRRGYDKNASHFKPKKYEKAFPKALAAVHKSNCRGVSPPTAES